ncbi:hypothetical protein [Kitasatospora cineracea]|uniref:Uncharacterized protein n=1 Tax=Kitasatospora cineracea TaxID=88074 RepID=A0A8G1UKY8_9ACTN|nr:hypothetical protein [Kitasatospora cineracea]ROR45778.1 hypothetical protein EDD39_4025 [Kitasatospora cineracea]
MPARNDGRDPEGTTDDRPYLFVHSYPPPVLPAGSYPVDNGTRPVPPEVCWYLCSGIQPLTAFQPGEDLTVQVTVGNWQGGNSESIAYLGLWWSPPVSGPLVPDADKFLGFTTVVVPPHGGQVVSDPLTGRIPADSGDHICLLAKVWHPLDLPPTDTAAPVTDRHWAQHNLVVLPSGSAGTLPFLASNPLTEEAEYLVSAGPVPPTRWAGFRLDGDPRPVAAGAGPVVLTGPDGQELARGEGEASCTLTLGGGERRPLEVTIEPAGSLAAGTFAPFEVVQYRRGEEVPAGGIGIAFTGG